MANFEKKDDSFVCVNCGNFVAPLGYSSRDHCNKCLCSLHVDIIPGDRQNDCKGLLVPVGVETNTKKGYVIVYKCQKCGKLHKNKTATDDDFEKILEIMKNQFWMQICWYIVNYNQIAFFILKVFCFAMLISFKKFKTNEITNIVKKSEPNSSLIKASNDMLAFLFCSFFVFLFKNFSFLFYIFLT